MAILGGFYPYRNKNIPGSLWLYIEPNRWGTEATYSHHSMRRPQVDSFSPKLWLPVVYQWFFQPLE